MNEWYKNSEQPPYISESDLRDVAGQVIINGIIEDVDYPDIQPKDRRLPHIYTLFVGPEKLQAIKDASYSSGQYEKIMTVELIYSEQHAMNMEGHELGEMLSVSINSDTYPSQTEGALVSKKNVVYFLPLTPDQESGVMETHLDVHGHRMEYLTDTPAATVNQVVHEMRPLTAADVELLRELILQR